MSLASCSTSTPAGEPPPPPPLAASNQSSRSADNSEPALLRVRSLTVWVNGKRRGVMVPSGLVGPLRWAVDVRDASVHIDGPKPPPAKPPPSQWDRRYPAAAHAQ